MKLRLPKKTSTRIALAAGALALIVILFLWLRPDPPPALATAPATVADIEQTVVATGTIEARELVSVGAQASGQIEVLHVELGDEVKAGDPIAEIDSTTQENSLRNARAALANMRAQRSAQVAQVAEAEANHERQRVMLAAEATSQAEYDSARAALAAARAQVESLDAQIEQAQTSLSTAQANLGYTRITAPMDGTVVAVVAKEGQTVNAGLSTPTIVKLAQLDTMTISAEISEADVIKIRPGMPVWFTILGAPDTRYTATLRSIEPAPTSIESDESAASTSTSQAVYYNALFDVDNPDGVLRISMTAQVNVVLAAAEDVLVIPATALGEKVGPDAWTVRVLGDDGRPQPRRIRTGINNNVSVQVLEGLEAGEQVVVGEASALPAEAEGMPRGMRGPRMMR